MQSEPIIVLIISVLAPVVAGIALACGWPSWVSWVLIVLANAYFGVIVFLCAVRSDRDAGVKPQGQSTGSTGDTITRISEHIFPSRTFGLLVAFSGFAVVALSFANIYMRDCIFDSRISDEWQAIYVSLMVLGFGGPDPRRYIEVICELLSALNIVICLLPMLVSRLSSFKDLVNSSPKVTSYVPALPLNAEDQMINLKFHVRVGDQEPTEHTAEFRLSPGYILNNGEVALKLTQSGIGSTINIAESKSGDA